MITNILAAALTLSTVVAGHPDAAALAGREAAKAQHITRQLGALDLSKVLDFENAWSSYNGEQRDEHDNNKDTDSESSNSDQNQSQSHFWDAWSGESNGVQRRQSKNTKEVNSPVTLEITNNNLLDTVKSSISRAQEDLNLPQLSERGLNGEVDVDTDNVKALVDGIVSEAGDAASDTLSALGLDGVAKRDISDVLDITDDLTDKVDDVVAKVGDVADDTLSDLGLSGLLKRDVSDILDVTDDVTDTVDDLVGKVGDVADDTLSKLGLSGILKREPSGVLGVTDDLKDALKKTVSKVDDAVADTVHELLPRDAPSTSTSGALEGLLQAKRDTKSSPARLQKRASRE